MHTSNFKTHGRDPRGIAICNGTRGYPGVKTYKALAPPMWAVKQSRAGQMSEQEFTRIYTEQLSRLDPHRVYNDLLKLHPEPILLCWEKPGEFCHRHLAAKWLEQHVGQPVREISGPDPGPKAQQQRLL